MNTIFIKEVADTVLKRNKAALISTHIGNGEHIKELCISKKVLDKIKAYIEICNDNNVIKTNIKSTFHKCILKVEAAVFNKDIRKIITKNCLNGYKVIYSNALKRKSTLKNYIEEILKKYDVNEYIFEGSIKNNIYKYIEEYEKKHNLSKHLIKPLVIASDVCNIDINMIKSLNDNYKEIDIVSPKKYDRRFQNKISSINEESGSCINLLDKKEKDFREYNVYLFVDSARIEYNKYRFSRNACFIDFTTKDNDKFNEFYLELERKVKSNIYDVAKIKELYDLYGRVTVSNAILK